MKELPFEGAIDMPEPIASGVFLMVCSGETYQTTFIRGEDLLTAWAGAQYSKPTDMPLEDLQRDGAELANLDNWYCVEGKACNFKRDVGEMARIEFHRIADAHSWGIEMIALERERQLAAEGFDPDHDDKHVQGEIAHAGSAYAETAALQAQHGRVPSCFIPRWWPWERKWWKPSQDPVRNLVRAGALIAAEIDRLMRAKREAKS